MGLSIGSLADVLLPLAPGTAPTAAGDAQGGDFAALLQALFSEAGGEQGAGEDLLATLPQGESTESDDQLAAALAGAELASQFASLVPDAFVMTNAANSTETSIGAVAPQLEGETVPSMEIGGEPDAVAPAAASDVEAQPEVALAETAGLPLEVALEVVTTDAAPPAMQPESAFEATTETAEPADTEPAQAEKPADGTDPAVAIETQDSVVRFVGNADSSNTNTDGRRREADGQPNAAIAGVSATSQASGATGVDASTPVDAPVASAAREAVQAETPPAVHRVEQAAIERIERGGGEAHIRLDPPELGAVHIRVRIDGDAVHVHVDADQQSAANLLRQHTTDLSSLLGDRGLNLADVFVGFGNEGSASNGFAEQRGSGASGRNSNSGDFAAILGIEPETATATAAHNRLRSAYNPDGQYVYLA